MHVKRFNVLNSTDTVLCIWLVFLTNQKENKLTKFHNECIKIHLSILACMCYFYFYMIVI